MPDPRPGVDADEQAARPPGLRRLGHALLRPSRGQVVLGVLLALLGFAAVTQVRTAGDDATYAGYREQDLIEVLNGLSATTQRAQAEIRRLERERDDLRDDTQSRRVALDRARTEAETLSVLAGQVAVTGPGIRITIEPDDEPVRVDTFLDMLQGLRTAGAEAIQLNGTVRVVAQTYFDEGVGGLTVEGERLKAPYVVDVIGEPDALTAAITFPKGPRFQLQDIGAEVAIDELSSLDIESVREADEPQFAQPEGGQ
ncbi:DUF881 domain-containing protein [Nocardioides sp. SYSU D00038]|uniref:DUF881 domain-containing protein n=1 Tax=Nocardioides sp. SYSU D00038 TaxID=2812554 RepID=UPI0027DCB48A|nr:DUF881 domain-containing protein [Nocardioides sp. SYSU D00038]